ncbi:MarR family transcriptional regulator [Candidatus Dependentiae bacterium]|nr:MAG: MarR family transcriptional regulator [Candidatus Dependentiae bacterium]
MKTKHLPFSIDKPEKSPGLSLWQATTTWQRLIKKTLEEYEVSHAQFVILAVTFWLEKQNLEIQQSIIIKWTKLDKMTVSQALKKLSQKKIVIQKENSNDTRAKLISLTKTGATLTSKLISLVEIIDEKFFKKLNKDEKNQLLFLLQKLI